MKSIMDGIDLLALLGTVVATFAACGPEVTFIPSDIPIESGNELGSCGDGAGGGGGKVPKPASSDTDAGSGDGCPASCVVENGWICLGSPGVCADIDECAELTDNCDINGYCMNRPGSFDCACQEGFLGDGITCVDSDECQDFNGDCDPNATCINWPGFWSCECNPGYVGDGFACFPE